MATLYCVHVVRGPGIIETIKFDDQKAAMKYERKLLLQGVACCCGPDYPSTIEEEKYEQLKLF